MRKDTYRTICDIRKLLKKTGSSLPPDVPYLIEEKHYQDLKSDNYLITERKYHFRPWFGRLSNTSCIKKFGRHKKVGLIHRDKYLENLQDFVKLLKKK